MLTESRNQTLDKPKSERFPRLKEISQSLKLITITAITLATATLPALQVSAQMYPIPAPDRYPGYEQDVRNLPPNVLIVPGRGIYNRDTLEPIHPPRRLEPEMRRQLQRIPDGDDRNGNFNLNSNEDPYSPGNYGVNINSDSSWDIYNP